MSERLDSMTGQIESNYDFVTLCCSRDFDMAIECYRSFVQNASGVRSLIVYDDGTLSHDQAAAFIAMSPKIKVSRLSDRDEYIAKTLSRFPNCRSFRKRHPLGMKLLDAVLVADKDVYFIDSDIMFIKKFSLNFLEKSEAISMKENDQGYSGNLLQLKKIFPSICSGVNTGFFKLPRGSLDLELAEYFLSKPEFQVNMGLVEQTILAILLSQCSLSQLCPNQFPCDLTLPHRSDTKEVVAIHFLYFLKERWPEYVPLIETNVVKEVSVYPSKRLSHLEILRRRLRRLLLGNNRRIRSK